MVQNGLFQNHLADDIASSDNTANTGLFGSRNYWSENIGRVIKDKIFSTQLHCHRMRCISDGFDIFMG